jgi:hypothetical protein
MNLALLDELQKEKLKKLLRSRKSIMPHEVCVMLRVNRFDAISILADLMQQYPDKITRKTLIYCNCGIDSDNAPPSVSIPYEDTIQAMPEIIKCSLCDDEIAVNDNVGIDEVFVLTSAIYL